jgi:hypothetical protein
MSKASKQAWVTGTTCVVPVRQPALYLYAERLGLDMENKKSWLDSPELCAWIDANKNEKFVFEWMLRKLKLTTIWDSEDRKPTTLVPDEPIENLVNTELEPEFVPDYL